MASEYSEFVTELCEDIRNGASESDVMAMLEAAPQPDTVVVDERAFYEWLKNEKRFDMARASTIQAMKAAWIEAASRTLLDQEK